MKEENFNDYLTELEENEEKVNEKWKKETVVLENKKIASKKTVEKIRYKINQ